MLLQNKNIDVNAQYCWHVQNDENTTVLAHLCEIACESTLGVKMLLWDSRTDVNKGTIPPLFYALQHIRKESDYFHLVAELLLHHKHIDVNAEFGDGTILSELCRWKIIPSVLGTKLLLKQGRLHTLCKGSPVYWAARLGNAHFEMILNHPHHNVNIVCEICKNYLPVTMIEYVQKLDSRQGQTLKLIIDSRARLNVKCLFIYSSLNRTPLSVFACRSN